MEKIDSLISFFIILNIVAIFWNLIGYKYFLEIIFLIFKKKYIPTVQNLKTLPPITLLIVAHNESLVIKEKLLNTIGLDYPVDKIEIFVVSDQSNDGTDDIVNTFIKKNYNYRIKFLRTTTRSGKTNAQNEAVKKINNEIIVFSDANSIFKNDALKLLVNCFNNPKVGYVSGKITYLNSNKLVARLENNYWNTELRTRELESRIYSITAGNGGIYACRKKLYKFLKPIEGHDLFLPLHITLSGFKAQYCPDAIAFEKAGEYFQDEYKRKLRMNRGLIKAIMPDFRILNFFKHGIFTFFYLSHRTLRYSLWLLHLNIFISLTYLSIRHNFWIINLGFCFFICLFFVIFKNVKIRVPIVSSFFYYLLTILAQLVAVKKIIFREYKSTWSKASSTR